MLFAPLLAAFWVITPVPGLPTLPPAPPTQIVQSDGTRVDCSPNYTACDWNTE